MKSRTMISGPENLATLQNALPAEFHDRLLNYYLPWIETAIATLELNQVWKHPGEGMNSIGNLMLHLEGNVRQWIIHGLGGEKDDRRRDAEFAARSGESGEILFEKLRKTVEEACHVVDSFQDESRLLEEHSIQGFRTTSFDAIFHVAEHFSYHTGQIVLLARMMTGSDFRFYDL